MSDIIQGTREFSPTAPPREGPTPQDPLTTPKITHDLREAPHVPPANPTSTGSPGSEMPELNDYIPSKPMPIAPEPVPVTSAGQSIRYDNMNIRSASAAPEAGPVAPPK